MKPVAKKHLLNFSSCCKNILWVFYCRIWFFAQKWEMYFPKGLVCNLDMLVSLERAGAETHQLGLFHQFHLSSKQDPWNIWSLRYWRFRIELFSDRSVSSLLSPPASQQFKFNNIQKIHLLPHVNQQSFAHFHIEYILFTPPGKTRRKTFTNFLFLTHKVSETCCLSENGNNTGLCVF